MQMEQMEQAFKDARSAGSSTELLSRLTKISRLMRISASSTAEVAAFYSPEVHVRWLMALLCSGNLHVSHASAKLLLACSKYLSDHPADWGSFLSALWENTTEAGIQGVGPALLLLRNIGKVCSGQENIGNFLTLLGDNMPVLATFLDSKHEVPPASTRELALGALLKLLCTSVRRLEEADRTGSFLNSLESLLPALALQSQACTCLPRFIRYKCLVLLMRLAELRYPALSWTCLREVSSAAKDLLELPLPKEPAGEEILLHSPFTDDVKDLQRRALVILFKTVHTAMSSEKLKDAASEVFLRWLTYQAEAMEWQLSDLVVSLIYLYADEDDLLLEMLMLLLEFKLASSENNDTYNNFAAAISPLRLFHLFLAAIYYDHSVLIDLLISKNTGLPCVQFLLRCLRSIVDSWPEFTDASILNVKKKRRRTGSEVFSLEISLSRAKVCLAQLETSISRLQNKCLFPYNASPLLERCRMVNHLLQHSDD